MVPVLVAWSGFSKRATVVVASLGRPLGAGVARSRSVSTAARVVPRQTLGPRHSAADAFSFSAGISLTTILSAFFSTVDSPMPLTAVRSAALSKRPWVSRC